MSSIDQSRRVHYFHAEAHAIGGHIEQPFQQIITAQAPLSLPAVGGHANSRVDRFRIDSILSVESMFTEVSGVAHSKNGPWSAMVTTVIEGLNLLNVFTADRIVAQISSEHPAEGYYPKITFAGTQFQNVQIAGTSVKVDLDLGICDQQQRTKDGFPVKSCREDEDFLAKVEKQYAVLNGRSKTKQGEVLQTPAWVKERYRWDETSKDKDFVLGSIVDGIALTDRDAPASRVFSSFGNIFEIPQFGRGFLGELIVSGGTYRLIMFRLELGCANQGMLDGGDIIMNSNTNP